MKIFLRILKWLGLVLFVVLVTIIAYLHTIDFSVSEEEIARRFQNATFQPEFHNLDQNGRNIHYVAVGDKSKPIVMFVHGSPGSWDAFIAYMNNPKLLEAFRFISVDRHGFGKSGSGKPERSLEVQAEAFAQILEIENSDQPAFLVGHSYGGPVIARMAMDFPERVNGLVIVAGSIDPELEKTLWYQIPIHYKVLSWVVPDLLYSTNEEILALKQELEEMVPLWKDITIPVEVIQGGIDELVPPGNADFAKQMLVNTEVTMTLIPEMDHFVPWSNPELIRNALYNMLDKHDELAELNSSGQ